jgi:small subunit ribosomal protein S20
LPITKSAIRGMRVAARKEARNQPVLSETKTHIANAEKLIASGKADEAKAAVQTAISTLDKAAQKGIIHANNAGRRKARLVKKLNQAKPASK